MTFAIMMEQKEEYRKRVNFLFIAEHAERKPCIWSQQEFVERHKRGSNIIYVILLNLSKNNLYVVLLNLSKKVIESYILMS